MKIFIFWYWFQTPFGITAYEMLAHNHLGVKGNLFQMSFCIIVCKS